MRIVRITILTGPLSLSPRVDWGRQDQCRREGNSQGTDDRSGHDEGMEGRWPNADETQGSEESLPRGTASPPAISAKATIPTGRRKRTRPAVRSARTDGTCPTCQTRRQRSDVRDKSWMVCSTPT